MRGLHCRAQEEVAKANAAGQQNPECPDDVDLHRPIVDDFTLVSDSGEVMHREPFVMDCWFDSGCASFAQWHHPFDDPEKFENNFPIDYICEGVDQTRGWFYASCREHDSIRFDLLQALLISRTYSRC